MKLLAWNCRVLGNVAAVRQLTAVVRRSNPDILILSETRLVLEKFQQLMNKMHFTEILYVSPIGLSGGFGVCWKQRVLCKIMEADKNVLIGTIESDPPGISWNFMGIYGPPSMTGRELFWNRIGDLLANGSSPTVLLGDLNGTLADHECLYYTNQNNAARYSFDLRRMVARTGLIDLGCLGGKFTWFQKTSNSTGSNAIRRARLDRALASTDWRILFPNAIVELLTVSTSDHKPILLNTDGGVRCTKAQFKYELMWGRDPRCFWVVRNAWRERLHHNPMVNLYRKLKRTRDHLQRWNKTHFKKIHQQVTEAKNDLAKIESNDQVQWSTLGDARAKLNEALRREEVFWRQKSRVTWLRDGDHCTKFFMASTVVRRRKNYIQTIKNDNGEWITDQKAIAEAFVSRFNSIFTRNPLLSVPDENFLANMSINEQDNRRLVCIPTEKEIEGSLRSMGHDKAPGPDGMSAGFYLQHWSVVKMDFIDMVSHFFTSLELPQFINNTNIVLIPKKDCPLGVNDFRPIALCNVAYICISKILALRLKHLLPSIISPEQTAFVHGRLIAENTAVAREIVHSMKKKKGKKGFMMIKLDMEKAYDKMDWEFILNTLKGLGFHQNFVRWVEKCIQIRKLGLLINGSVQGMVSPSCGLRQGDPLSPALFIIAADVLSRLITTRKAEGKLAGFRISREGPAITHLMFADDVILFGRASVKEAKGFIKCLEEYCSWSGQAVNYQKSTVFFTKGVSATNARDITSMLNMKRMKEDATYLGLPLFRSLNRSRDLRFLVDRALQRVKSWKTRLLSKAGRACLIQSVGSSVATYVAASDPIPLNIAHKVDKCLRDFWWGDTEERRKLHLLAWNAICQSKMRGGLGFRSVSIINKAFMTKWAWKALTDNSSVWSKVVNAKYLKGREFLNLERNGDESAMWKAVLQAREVLEQGICKKIGNGAKTSIWFDPWVPSSNRTPTPLKDVSHGIAWVKQFVLSNNRWNAQMIKEWFSPVDASAILNIDLPDEAIEDSWVWMGEPNGKFSIRSACRILKRDTEVNGDSEVWKLIWNSPLHTRLKFVWWQLIRDIFPTKDKLAPFLDGITGTCLLCREEAENSLHLFWKCTFTKAIWFSIGWGIRTEMVTATDWKQWMEGFWKGLNLPPNIDFYDFMVTCLCIVESVWKERNRRVHGEMEKDIMQISRSIRQKINDHIMVSEKIVHEITEWRPPPSDWVCCNSDVAVSPVGSFLSAVIRDDVGNIISISSQESRVTLPKLAEAKAVCLAAEKAKDLGLKKIMFQSDNIGVVKAFEASMDICMDFMLQDSKVRFNNICSKFSDWGIVHVSRKCNYMAHNIAKWAAVKNVLGICQEEVDASVLDDLREWEPDLGRDTLGSGDVSS
ncbi:hypothetical protein CsatB_023871 [Cannabis sativa]